MAKSVSLLVFGLIAGWVGLSGPLMVPAKRSNALFHGRISAVDQTLPHTISLRSEYMPRSAFQKYRPSYSTFAVLGPLIVCVILNALIRPWLADQIGGTVIRTGSSVRSNNRWWTFAETTQTDHPLLTWFLSVSDGAVAMAAAGLVVIFLLIGWIVHRFRTMRPSE
jgi:hypothetical protein